MTEHIITDITDAAKIQDPSEREIALARIMNSLPQALRDSGETVALLVSARGDASYSEARLAVTGYTERIVD